METAAETYQQRKELGLCTRCGQPAADDSSLCPEHRDDHRAAANRYAESLRAERSAKGQCPYCPRKRETKLKDGEAMCPACRVERRRMPRSLGVVDKVVDKAKIEAATRKDGDGRTRYHGQGKRGQQPKYQLNVQDLRHVKADFEKFESGVVWLAGPDAEQRHKTDRDKVEWATANCGGRAARRINDILERLGHAMQRHGSRPGEATVEPETDDPDDTTLNYKRPADASKVAAAATPGQYIYAPPLDVVSGRRETAKDPKPPDLAPLREGLARRGLGLVAEGAYYWRVTSKNGE